MDFAHEADYFAGHVYSSFPAPLSQDSFTLDSCTIFSLCLPTDPIKTPKIN